MPRSSSDREFGFKAPGIVRILLTANADEVLKAFLTLGIDPTSDEAFAALSTAVIELIAAPVVAALEGFDLIVGTIAELVELGQTTTTSITETQLSAIANAGKIATGQVLTTKQEIEALHKAFQERMDGANAEFPQFVWPATPGVFEAA